jgi:polar amino acid transport system substrate-binding protein
VDGEPQTVAAVDRWLGPGSALNIPQERIRGVFDGLLMGVEALRPLPAGQ